MATLGHLLDGNTLALYRLDETSSSAAAADAGGRFNIAVNAGAPAVSAGLIADGGKSRSGFTSGPAYFETTFASATAENAMLGDCSFEGWILLNSLPAGLGRIFYAANNNQLFCVRVDANGSGYGLTVTWHWGAGGANFVSSSDTTLLALGARYHISIRRAATGGSLCKLMFGVNGVTVSTVTGLHIPDRGNGTAGNCSFDLGAQGGLNPIDGTLDDIRLSTLARTDAEIADSFWRGLLDRQSPQFAVPPLQVTGNQDFQNYQDALAPTALQDPTGTLFESAFGSMKDVFADRIRLSLKARLPQNAPPDALTQIGTERGMPQGQTEIGTAYATRLQDAWNAWPWAGTPFGLLRAFYATGYTNVVLAQVRGGKQFTLDNGGINFLKWSNAFANWAGGFAFSFITSNALAGLDGTTTASKLVEGANNNQHYFTSETFAVTAGTKYTLDVYAKAGGRQLVIAWTDGFPAASYDLTLGTVVDISGGGTGSIASAGGGWYRCAMTFTAATTGSFAYRLLLSQNGAASTAYLGDGASGVYLWMAQAEPGTLAGTLAATVGTPKTTALAAGSLLTSTMANGIWETDPLTSYSPVNQGFWSKFDVVFPLPLMPPNWGWSAGIPASNSNESNFIRALIKAWAPAHASCDRIIIVQQGNVWGYPATQLWGASTGLWGGSANTLWTP